MERVNYFNKLINFFLYKLICQYVKMIFFVQKQVFDACKIK